jgi:hypothetical protein
MSFDSSPEDDSDFAPILYNTRMQLEYRGSFRYIDQRAVDLAIGEAAEHLEDDGLSHLDREWMRFVRRRGTTLHVEATLPTSADRYVAAAVLGALAKRAIEGCVDVMRGGHVVDAFAPEA